MASRQRIERDLITQLNMALEQGDFARAERLNGFIQELHGGAWPAQREIGIGGRPQAPPAMPAPDGGYGPRFNAPAAVPQNPPTPVPLPSRRPVGGRQAQPVSAPNPSDTDWIGAPPFPPAWQQIVGPNRGTPDPVAGGEMMGRLLFGPDSLTESQAADQWNARQAPQAPGQQRPYTVEPLQAETVREPEGAWILREAIANAGPQDREFPDRFRAEIGRIAGNSRLFDSLDPAYKWLVSRIHSGVLADAVLRAFGEHRYDGDMSLFTTLAGGAGTAAGLRSRALGAGFGYGLAASTLVGEGAHRARMGWANRSADDLGAFLDLSPEQLAKLQRVIDARSRMHPRRQSRMMQPPSLLRAVEMNGVSAD